MNEYPGNSALAFHFVWFMVLGERITQVFGDALTFHSQKRFSVHRIIYQSVVVSEQKAACGAELKAAQKCQTAAFPSQAIGG